ncbi:ABC transporter permease [Geothrix sp. 21YS21S-2]|uniref:cell division protein FtsX n=1 Tax=Geothrix sp. 21YS21S-2 TaxID=3068893 RepID=UPI0027B8FE97|nr:FtsX-like permease family protein [Geothrix sp. 21YS21S-2]
MVFFRLLGLLVRDVVNDLFRHRGQHFLAVLTLASGLLLAGGGLLVVQGLDRWVSRMEGLARITVFANEGGGLDQAEGQLRRDPRFAAVRRISSQETTRRFMETTRDAGLMLKSLGEPIPETLELSLRPDLLAARKAIEVGESLRSLPGVGDVVVDQERLEGLQKTARLMRSALSSFGVLLLVAAGFATGNVIRMCVMTREEEITIMRLVGATEGFIRTPLLVEGGVLGLLASMVAVLGLLGLWWPVAHGMGRLSPLLVELARLGFFSAGNLALIAFIGTATGALGALWGFWSTQRALRKSEALMEQRGA